jgi:hypothetical protein
LNADTTPQSTQVIAACYISVSQPKAQTHIIPFHSSALAYVRARLVRPGCEEPGV